MKREKPIERIKAEKGSGNVYADLGFKDADRMLVKAELVAAIASIISERQLKVSDAKAEQLFVNEPLLVLQDAVHSSSEVRWHALGRTNEGRMLHATFTLRAGGTRVRIISARPMHRKERKVYDSASQAKP